jgi:hypothetical protein
LIVELKIALALFFLNTNTVTFWSSEKVSFFDFFLTHFRNFFGSLFVRMFGDTGLIDTQHTCQENESEILLNFCEKIVVFRCRKNYRLDLLRCMREILKLKKNDFWLFWSKKNVSLFLTKKVTLFLAKNDTFFDSFSFKLF